MCTIIINKEHIRVSESYRKVKGMLCNPLRSLKPFIELTELFYTTSSSDRCRKSLFNIQTIDKVIP